MPELGLSDKASQLRHTIAELSAQLADSQSLNRSKGLHFCAALKALSESLDFSESLDSEALDYADSLSLLYQNAADACPGTLASSMFSALEAAVQRYSRSVLDNELTSMHAALATLCAEHHLYSADCLPFAEVSDTFAPVHGVGDYFAKCSLMHAERKDWESAALHAALTVVRDPDVSRWRLWVLYELIAYGKMRELPRIAESPEKCPLVAELATHFATISRASGEALRRFCAEHELKFKDLGIWPLVQRVHVAFYINWMRVMSSSWDVISWDILEPALSPVSLADLLAAGLERDFIVRNDPHSSTLIAPRSTPRDDEVALRLLNEVSALASKASQRLAQTPL